MDWRETRKKDMSYYLMLLILNNTIESYMCVFLHVWSAAPHEICKDEYQGLMTWKRASAGETVYNKCPTNATGEWIFVPDTLRTGLSLSFTFIQTELYCSQNVVSIGGIGMGLGEGGTGETFSAGERRWSWGWVTKTTIMLAKSLFTEVHQHTTIKHLSSHSLLGKVYKTLHNS